VKYKIAVVYWTDAAIHGSDCMTREDWIAQAGLVPGISVGHILHETKEEITLAMDWFKGNVTGKDCFRVVGTYPKSGIQKIIRQTIEV
jgi:hypothetical protein